MAQAQDITMPPMTDKTGRQLIEALKGVAVYPNISLSVSNNRLNVSFNVYDYDPELEDGYEVGDMCLQSGLIKVCIEDTPAPPSTFDPNKWENYFDDYDPDEKYKPNDVCVYSGAQKVCIHKTTGVYDSTCWADF